MRDLTNTTINWDRAIHIDSPIDDELVRSLTPQILSLRQRNSDPITVGINSPGGAIASLDVLLGVLRGRDQDGNVGHIITVATNRAYSAAANLLALGDYSVALRHAQILYHDVRFGGMDDVTPEKARNAAKSLQDANDAFALKLAHRVIQRLIWIYIDLRVKFDEIRTSYPVIHERYSKVVSNYAPVVNAYDCVDLSSFATAIWAGLSANNDVLIENVMRRLGIWITFTNLIKAAPTFRKKGSRIPGLLDGLRHLHKQFSGKPTHFEESQESLKMLSSLIVAEISETKTERVDFPTTLERSVREYAILDSMNDAKHVRYATDLMLQNGRIFFGREFDGNVDGLSEEKRNDLFGRSAPHARLLWHFCVILCRELFEGEHILKPNDAQLLGLVDEVSGGGPVQSKREFRVEMNAKEEEQKKLGIK